MWIPILPPELCAAAARHRRRSPTLGWVVSLSFDTTPHGPAPASPDAALRRGHPSLVLPQARGYPRSRRQELTSKRERSQYIPHRDRGERRSSETMAISEPDLPAIKQPARHRAPAPSGGARAGARGETSSTMSTHLGNRMNLGRPTPWGPGLLVAQVSAASLAQRVVRALPR